MFIGSFEPNVAELPVSMINFFLKIVPSLNKYEVIPRNTSDEVVAYNVSELDEILKDTKVPRSLQNCNDSYKGRITTAAVHALKAKTLLFAASPLFNKSNDRAKWKKAAIAGKAAIDYVEAMFINFSQTMA